MQIFFVIMMFIMGTVFGSFLTLAVYRIPLNKNITYERSFCPKCNHRLEFIDLIPVLSYISLKGKCRYCGEKVRIRYLLLEVLSGIIFVLAFLSLNFSVFNIEFDKIVYFIAFVMFFITVCLLSGIDKEYINIDKRVLLFGLIMQSAYELYLYFWAEKISAVYIICLVIYLLLLVIDTIFLEKGEIKYLTQVLMFLTYILMFIPSKMWWLFGIVSVFLIILKAIYNKIKFNFLDKPDILKEIPKLKMPIVFLIGISAIGTSIITNFLYF